MKKILDILSTYSGSTLNIVGSILQNFILIYFASKSGSPNFLYFNTIILTITSSLYSIENAFQYHFGRILNSCKKSENELNRYKLKFSLINSQLTKEDTFSIQITIIRIFYNTFISINFLIFSILYISFYEYRYFVILYFFISSLQVFAGYYSMLLISNDMLKKLHRIIGITKIQFVFWGTIIIFLKISSIIFLLTLLFCVLIQIILLKKNTRDFSITNNEHVFSLNEILKIFNSMSKAAIKQSAIVIVGFILLKCYLFFGSSITTKNTLSSISLIQNFYSLTLMFGGMYTVLNMNIFYTSDNKTRQTIFKKSIFFSLLIFFLGSIFIYFVNEFLLIFINYQKINLTLLLTIATIYFFETILGITATLFLYLQKVVYFNSSILSAFIILTFYFISYFYFKTYLTIQIILFCPFFVQLAFNYWYYPIRLYKELNE